MLKAFTVLVWILASIAALFVITLPISVQAQLVAVFLVLAVMVVLKLLDLKGGWRLVALALGTAIVLRYVYWRTTGTLPPVNQLQNFIPGFLLYLAEMYSVFMLFLSLFVVAAPLAPRRSRAQDASDNFPTVDVFVPTYNEDAALLANTLAAALQMDYPSDRLKVWLLDDGGSLQKRNSAHAGEAHAAETRHRELKALCKELGAIYLTRERNEHAKAGNLNNGLKHSTGDLVAVFDADHAPARDFLLETVGYFDEDEKLFLVQTPHFFLNPDPVERNLRTFDRMPSENEMFYGVIQRGLDKWNAAFFCGSAAVLSRRALAETNGFSGVSITEDCETALELHSRGWHSIYVDKPLIAGLQPATFASFIGQRSRWAQGMMQILRFRFPPAKRGLTLSQRLCYMSSTLFWLFPFPRAIFLVAPLFYLFFGLQIFTASGGEFLAYTLTYMVVNLMMQNYLYGSYRWPWISELYEYVQTVHLLPAVVSVMMNPRKPTFKVTAKDESILYSRLSELSVPFFAVFAVLLIAVGATAWRIYAEPYRADLTLVVGAWNVLNLLLAGCALGVVSERGTRSQYRRVKVARRAELLAGDVVLPATIEDVSVGGARVRSFGTLPATLKQGDRLELRFRPAGSGEASNLPVSLRSLRREADGATLGVQYEVGAPRDHFLIADLVFASSDQWRDFQLSRRRNIGVLRGTLWFYSLCIFETYRGFVYLLRGSTEKRQSAPESKRAVPR